MENLENARAQSEAGDSAPAPSSADRARFWAGLNRYLASEAAHAHKEAEHERAKRPPSDGDSSGTARES